MDNLPELIRVAWLYLKARRLAEEAEQRHNEWTARQQANIERWERDYKKHTGKLREVEAAIARLNQSRKDALFPENYEQIDKKLAEKRAFAEEIRGWNRKLQFKIEDVIRTLNGQPSRRPVRLGPNVVRASDPVRTVPPRTIRFKR